MSILMVRAWLTRKITRIPQSQHTSCVVSWCCGILGGSMVQVTSLRNADIHIDTCSVCYGQWLDGGELEGLSDQGFIAKVKSLFK